MEVKKDMANLKNLEEQVKTHNWWKANREKIRERIIKNFNLKETFKI
jgi:hypothetical protein